MSINRWFGLGTISNPFDRTGLSSVASIDGNKLIVDHLNIDSDISDRVTNLSPSPFSSIKNSSSPWNENAFDYAIEKVNKTHPLLVKDFVPQIFSDESAPAPSNTLFRNFDFQSFPFYNFWTFDEEFNDNNDISDRKLEDVPRFIKLSWKIAPDIQGKKVSIANDPAKRKDFNKKIPINSANGLQFKLDHLDDFKIKKTMIANDILNNGILNSIVELNNGISQVHDFDMDDLVDEDSFLDNDELAGIDLNELRLNLNQSNSLFLKTSKMNNDGFINNFLLKSNNGNVSIKNYNDVGIGLDTKTFTKEQGNDSVINTLKKVSVAENNIDNSTKDTAVVRFIDTAIGGVLNDRFLKTISKPEHAEALLSVYALLPQLQNLSDIGFNPNDKDIQEIIDNLPSFDSPNGLKDLEYVGYVIEKSRLGDGTFEVVETIDITKREIDFYYDSKIVYGETYRYRIKSILRWTREDKKNLFITTLASPTKKLAPLKSTYFESDWSAPYTYATIIDNDPPPPPDELQLRTESYRKRIVVSFKIPYDFQRDILKFRLYRKLKDENGNDLTNWVEIAEFPMKNVVYNDYDVDFFDDNRIQYVYAAQTISKHNEVSYLSEQLLAKLNKNWKLLGEYPIKFVSNAGVKPDYFGSFSIKPFLKLKREVIFKPNQDKDTQKCSFTFSGRDRFSSTEVKNTDYLIRVESLDTGEIVEEELSIVANTVIDNIVKNNNRRNLSVKNPLFNPYLPFFGKLF